MENTLPSDDSDKQPTFSARDEQILNGDTAPLNEHDELHNALTFTRMVLDNFYIDYEEEEEEEED